MSSETHPDPGSVVIGVFVGVVLGLGITACSNDNWREEAIRHKAARWVVAVDGTTKFEWITPPAKQKDAP